MKKILFLFAVPFTTCVNADPGIMIDIDIIFEKPSGPGGATLGFICK